MLKYMYSFFEIIAISFLNIQKNENKSVFLDIATKFKKFILLLSSKSINA